MATRWFLWFWLRACGIRTPDFWTLTTEWKCRTMVERSLFITFASSRVHCRGSLWINVFKLSTSNPESLPERGVSLTGKLSSLKRENHFLAVLSPMALSPYAAQMFLAASAVFAPLLYSKRRICQKCSNFSTWLSPFSSVYGSTHYRQMTKLQYVTSSTITELQTKNYNR